MARPNALSRRITWPDLRLQARGAAAAAIATAAGFPFIGQVLRRFWSPDTEDVMTRYLTVLARTVVETYIDKSSFPSCALLPRSMYSGSWAACHDYDRAHVTTRTLLIFHQ